MRKAWLANLFRISGAFPDAAPPTPGRPPRSRAPRPPDPGPGPPGSRPPGPRPAVMGQRGRGPAGPRSSGAPALPAWGSPGAAWGPGPAKSHGLGLGGLFLLAKYPHHQASVHRLALRIFSPRLAVLPALVPPSCLSEKGAETHATFRDPALLSSEHTKVTAWRYIWVENRASTGANCYL